MPPKKRTSAAANGSEAEPIAKRRSSRQAAAASASKATETAVTPEVEKKTKAEPVKAVKKTEKATAKPKAEKGAAGGVVKNEAKTTNAKKDAKKDTKKATAEENSNDRAGSEDPDIDSIPTVNPEAPRHDGEWYWLMKAEPETRMENGHDVRFSIDDLRGKTRPEGWDGIRAYPARNNMRNMNAGDKAFFYHSNCKEPGIVGVMEIVKEFSEDSTYPAFIPPFLALSFWSEYTRRFSNPSKRPGHGSATVHTTNTLPRERQTPRHAVL